MKNFSLKQFITSNGEVRIYINHRDKLMMIRKIWLYAKNDAIQIETDADDACFFDRRIVDTSLSALQAAKSIARDAMKENNFNVRSFAELRKLVNVKTAENLIREFTQIEKVSLTDYKDTKSATNAFEKFIVKKLNLKNFPKIDENINKSELKELYTQIIADILNF